jgi:FMN phosphatase YigB (HAD superfamily)
MISFIYFDVGGVVELDFSGTKKWEEMLRDMGINESNRFKFDRIWDTYKNRICIDCDVDSLIPIFKKECRLSLPNNYSFLMDFVNRFEPNPSIWPVLNKIQKKCKIGLLTNMYPRMFKAIQSRHIDPPLNWQVIIDSSVVGFQKPDRKIYEIAEIQARTIKSEILFVDNNIDNINGAKKFGWQTFYYDSTNPQVSSTKLLEYI